VPTYPYKDGNLDINGVVTLDIADRAHVVRDFRHARLVSDGGTAKRTQSATSKLFPKPAVP